MKGKIPLKGKTIEEIKVGERAAFQKTITETDVYLFAAISGDGNPAHINQIEAEKTVFKDRIVHGMLTASLISAVLGMQLPGSGTIYLGQDLKFVKLVYFGDTIFAEIEVLNKDDIKNIIKVSTNCFNQEGTLVVTGTAKVMPPK